MFFYERLITEVIESTVSQVVAFTTQEFFKKVTGDKLLYCIQRK